MVVNLNWSGNQVKDKSVLPYVMGVGTEVIEEEQIEVWLELCTQVLATASPHPCRPANWFYPQPLLDVSSCSHNKSPSSLWPSVTHMYSKTRPRSKVLEEGLLSEVARKKSNFGFSPS